MQSILDKWSAEPRPPNTSQFQVEHLREISEYPVLSQHVHSLFYQADSLKDVHIM